jgi:hypothetical protein
MARSNRGLPRGAIRLGGGVIRPPKAPSAKYRQIAATRGGDLRGGGTGVRDQSAAARKAWITRRGG